MSNSNGIGENEIARVLAQNGNSAKGRRRSAQSGSHSTVTKAMSLKNRSEIGKYLVAYGIEIAADQNGEVAAVMCACEHGHVSILKELSNFGIDINSRDPEGVTSLMVASLNGHQEIVDFLLQRGADLNATETQHGANALMCSAQNGHAALMKYLLDRGALIGTKTMTGFTPLHFAALNGERQVVEFLLTDNRCTAGIDVNSQDDDGVTPLMCACFCGNVEIVRKLIKGGADIHLTNNDGLSALMYGVASGHIDIVKVLTQNGEVVDKALLNADHTEQAIAIATAMGHNHIIDYFNGYDV